LLDRHRRPAPLLGISAKSSNAQLARALENYPVARLSGDVQSHFSHGPFAGTLRVAAEHATDGQHSRDTDIRVDQSYLSGLLWGQIASIGKYDRYYGASESGSTLLGNASRPITALSLQRANQAPSPYRILHWLGPWNYQLFAGIQEDYAAVPDAKLIGMRLTLNPLRNLEVGLSRVLQWGGDNRPESLSSLADALLGNSNTTDDNTINTGNDPANQLAMLDFRWLHPLGLHGLDIAGQLTGEDEANLFPTKNFGLLHIGYSRLLHNGSALYISLEGADMVVDRFGGLGGKSMPDISYVNSVYTDGYYEQGLPLGYPTGGDGSRVQLRGDIMSVSGVRYGFTVEQMQVNPTGQTHNRAWTQKDQISTVTAHIDYPFTCGIRLNTTLGVQESERNGLEPVGTLGVRVDTLNW
jgi:hypothetical protein